MKRKKGFTLIELLAVIVILALIALISTPIIIGVIDKARKGAFEDSAYGVLDAGRIYFVGKLADQNKFAGSTFTFPEGGDLKISGEKPAGGTLSLDSSGKQALALYDKDKTWCALKNYEEEKITIKEYKEGECKLNVTENAAKLITDKNTNGNTEGLFMDDFGNVRYRGNNNVTKNYVTFNNEMWRIIGVFDGKVKLIRNDFLLNPQDGSIPFLPSSPDGFYWDSHTIATGAEGNYGKNDWTTSDLQEYLNKQYYNGLTENAKKMIVEEKYYLGGIENTRFDKKQIYEKERGTTVYSGRPTKWTGKIALMYLSDYGYATSPECTEVLADFQNDICMNNDWLYRDDGDASEWTLTPYSTEPSYVCTIGIGYASGQDAGNFAFRPLRPVIYLDTNVKISGGNGTSSNPYILSL